MTVAGTATATGVLLVLLVVAGCSVGGQVTPVQAVVSPLTGQTVYGGGEIPPWFFVLGIVGFIAAIAGTFVPKLSPLLGRCTR